MTDFEYNQSPSVGCFSEACTDDDNDLVEAEHLNCSSCTSSGPSLITRIIFFFALAMLGLSYIVSLIPTSIIEDSRSHYSVLNVSPSASTAQILKSFKKLSRQFHPDKCSSSPKVCQERWIQIREAYDILKDPVLRLKYDRERL
ncbi:hypothetical protein RCL1_003977 [Eukaryota sp. TZLM3-RCL]